MLDENVRDVCDEVGKEDCTGVVTTVVGACNGVWIFMYGNFHLLGSNKVHCPTFVKIIIDDPICSEMQRKFLKRNWSPHHEYTIFF